MRSMGVPCTVDGYPFPCRAVVPNAPGSWKSSALSHCMLYLGIILVRSFAFSVNPLLCSSARLSKHRMGTDELLMRLR